MPRTSDRPYAVSCGLQLSVDLHHNNASVEVNNQQVGSATFFNCIGRAFPSC
jgi:hypothetical protein